MKYRLLILFLISLCTITFADTFKLGTTVISSFGLNFSGTDSRVSGVMGEFMIATFNGTTGNNYLTQGFLQNDGVVDELNDAPPAMLKVFPNPVKDKIYILDNTGAGIVHAVLHDISGKVVFNTMLDLRIENSIDMQSMKTGLYILRVFSVNGSVLIVTKIEKH